MSVINQMLKDLDARGGGDAQRRAALTAAGQGVMPVPRNALSLRITVVVAVLSTAVLTMLLVWWLAPLVATPADAPAPAVPGAVVAQAVPPPAAAPMPVPVAAPPPAAVEPVAAPPPAAAAPIPAPAVAPARADVPATAAADTAPARSRIEVLPAMDADPLATAREALAAGDAEDALRQLDAARPSPAHRAEADALAAAALQQLGRHEAAIAAYTRALRGEPDIGAWWVGLGISLEAASRGGEALSAYREAQRRGPLDAALADYVGERVDALSAADDSGATSR